MILSSDNSNSPLPSQALIGLYAASMRFTKWLVFNRSQKQLLISFGLVYFLLVIFCFSNSARDPGSVFFQSTRGYRAEYSARRVEDALNYLSAFNETSTQSDHASATEDPNLCIGIVTVNRPLTQNLDVTVGSLLDGLTPEQRSTVALQVLFAPTNPKKHPDYGKAWVTNTVDHILTYDDLDAPIIDLKRLEKKSKITEKSLIDYRLSLDFCYNNTTAPWILMVEDDIVAQKQWYDVMFQSLRTIRERQQRGLLMDWFYLRLFYTEKFLGWNSENWPVYLFWSLVIVSISAAIALCGRRRLRSTHGTLTNSFLAVICLGCIPSIILLYFFAGRTTTHPIQPGIHIMNENGCCSQALLFPRKNVPPVIEYLRYRQDYHPKAVDSVIEAFANEKKFDRLVISPSQMQHVGVSSYKEDKKAIQWEGLRPIRGAHGVWSMGFETAYTNDDQ